jgi:hypothetical protein
MVWFALLGIFFVEKDLFRALYPSVVTVNVGERQLLRLCLIRKSPRMEMYLASFLGVGQSIAVSC